MDENGGFKFPEIDPEVERITRERGEFVEEYGQTMTEQLKKDSPDLIEYKTQKIDVWPLLITSLIKEMISLDTSHNGSFTRKAWTVDNRLSIDDPDVGPNYHYGTFPDTQTFVFADGSGGNFTRQD